MINPTENTSHNSSMQNPVDITITKYSICPPQIEDC